MVFEELLWLLHVTDLLSDFPYQPQLLPVPAKLKANHNPTCLPSVYLLPIHAAVVVFFSCSHEVLRTAHGHTSSGELFQPLGNF